MSGITAALSAERSARVLNPLGSASSIGDQTPGTNAAGGFTLQADGTITYQFTGSLQTGDTAQPRWCSQTIAGIGASYWVRVTVTLGTLTTGTTGSWVSLGSAQAFMKGPSTTGNASAILTLEFASDSGGANIVSTSTGWVCGYTHT